MAWNIDGKTVLITGANTGIGLEAAVALAKAGARVGITSRDPSRGEAALADLKKRSGSTNVHLFALDLADFASIRSCANTVLSQFETIHVLINNAGLVLSKRTETKQGFETTFGVNHLGHFYLTELLLERIKASAPARIVNVSSQAHQASRGLTFDDLQSTRSYSGFAVYAASKLANIYFTRELARRLDGSGITVNALHPGVIASRFAADGDVGGVFNFAVKLARPFLTSPAKGARTTVYLASSDVVSDVTGGYFSSSKPAKPSKVARDDTAAARLWEISTELVSHANRSAQGTGPQQATA